MPYLKKQRPASTSCTPSPCFIYQEGKSKSSLGATAQKPHLCPTRVAPVARRARGSGDGAGLALLPERDSGGSHRGRSSRSSQGLTEEWSKRGRPGTAHSHSLRNQKRQRQGSLEAATRGGRGIAPSHPEPSPRVGVPSRSRPQSAAGGWQLVPQPRGPRCRGQADPGLTASGRQGAGGRRPKARPAWGKLEKGQDANTKLDTGPKSSEVSLRIRKDT